MTPESKPKITVASTPSELMEWIAGNSDNGGCEPGCGHTTPEHQAFDLGVEMGRQHGVEVENPYNCNFEPQEWDAWETGKSVGMQEYPPLNRKEQ